MEEKTQALHYISLICDAKNYNTDDENEQWQAANQSRLNQNFTILGSMIDELRERISRLEQEN